METRTRPLVRVRPATDKSEPTIVDVRHLIALQEQPEHILIRFDGGFALAINKEDGETVRQVWFRLNGYPEEVK